MGYLLLIPNVYKHHTIGSTSLSQMQNICECFFPLPVGSGGTNGETIF